VLTTRIQGDDLVSLLVIQPDGTILVVGTSQNAADVMDWHLPVTSASSQRDGAQARTVREPGPAPPGVA
jgi:hypothetical protein